MFRRVAKLIVCTVLALPGALQVAHAQNAAADDLGQRYFVALQVSASALDAPMDFSHQCLVLSLIRGDEADDVSQRVHDAVNVDIYRTRIIHLLYQGQPVPTHFEWLSPALSSASGPEEAAENVRAMMPEGMRRIYLEDAAAELGVRDAAGQAYADCERRVASLPNSETSVFDEYAIFVEENM